MKKNISTFIGPVIGLSIFSLMLWILHNELKQFRFHDILSELNSIPKWNLVLAIFLTILNYALLTFYDMLGFKYIGKSLSFIKISLTSFIAYAFSNNIGFMSLSGSAIRYRLYSAWGFSTLEITRVIAFSGILTFWLGFFTISAIVFIVEPVRIPPAFHLPFDSIRFIGIFFALLLLGYLLWTGTRKKSIVIRGWEFEMPKIELSVSLLTTACIDWLLFGGVLYALLPEHHPISFMTLMSVMLLAQLAGMISHVPGGIGVFETVILLLMPDIGNKQTIGTLLAFRAIYYLMPLCLAALVFGFYELFKRREKVFGMALTIRQTGLAVIPAFASFLTFLAGMVLQFSGATPALESRMIWLKLILPLPVMEASHLLGSVAGVLLLILSWGIYRRLDAAYHLVQNLFFAGIFFSLFKGADYEEALLLTFISILFFPFKKAFYRKSSFFSDSFNAGWFFAVLLVLLSAIWIGFFSYKHVDYSHELWWQFSFDSHASRFLRASVAGGIVLLLLAFLKLFHGVPSQFLTPRQEDFEKAKGITESSPYTSAQLALIGDKSFIFNNEQNAFIMYGIEGRSWISMGDPVGPKSQASELIWDFVELADQYNCRAVFYETGLEYLPYYLDMGLTLLKIGEEGRVDLSAFNLEGGSRKTLRHTKSKLEREGCSFEILPAESVPELLPRLKEISDHWLKEKRAREKQFSLGFFSPEYLRMFPLAIVRQQNNIVAFANLLCGANHHELSIDLMRYVGSAPGGVMDYLFISLFEWGKKQGYSWFNLGMAPFSGLEARSIAPVWNKFGAFLFIHGEDFYNFQGLRQYKNKFNPIWEPRYLAVPGGLALPLVLKDISALISRGVKGIMPK